MPIRRRLLSLEDDGYHRNGLAVLPIRRYSTCRECILAEELTGAVEHAASRRAVLTAATLVAGGIIVGGVGAPAVGSGSRLGDAEILNFALEMEELQAALYEQALQHAGLTGELAPYPRGGGPHERAHIAFLRQPLGPRAKPAPRSTSATPSPIPTGSPRRPACSRTSASPPSTARRRT